MDEQKYVCNQYLFSSKQQFEKAKEELEIINYQKEKNNFSDYRIALKAYNKFVTENTFETIIGYNFLCDLRNLLIQSGKFSEDSLSKIPILDFGETHAKEKVVFSEKYEKLYSYEKYRNKKLSICLFFSGILIFGMLLITWKSEYSIFTYFTNYEKRIEEKVIDRYESWEKQLSEREKILNEKNINEGND